MNVQCRIIKINDKKGLIKLTNKNEIKLFQNEQIRTKWDSEIEDYYFSVIDVIAVLTESKNPRKYWSVLKSRLNDEGLEVATNCSQLKMKAEDGKMRLTKCDWGQTYTFDIGCRLKIPEITKEPSCFRSVKSLSKTGKGFCRERKTGAMVEIGPCH